MPWSPTRIPTHLFYEGKENVWKIQSPMPIVFDYYWCSIDGTKTDCSCLHIQSHKDLHLKAAVIPIFLFLSKWIISLPHPPNEIYAIVKSHPEMIIHTQKTVSLSLMMKSVPPSSLALEKCWGHNANARPTSMVFTLPDNNLRSFTVLISLQIWWRWMDITIRTWSRFGEKSTCGQFISWAIHFANNLAFIEPTWSIKNIFILTVLCFSKTWIHTMWCAFLIRRSPTRGQVLDSEPYNYDRLLYISLVWKITEGQMEMMITKY